MQQQMTAMKQSFDERMGVMRNLLEQNTDVANKVSAAIDELAIVHQQTAAGSRRPGRPDLRADSVAERHHGRAQGAPCQAQQAIRGHAGGAAVHGGAAGASAAAGAGRWPRRPRRTCSTTMPCATITAAKNDSGDPGIQRLHQVLSQHGSGRKRVFLSSRNSVQGGRLPESDRELRSGSAEFSQRKQGGRRAAQEGIRAPRTRKRRRGHPGIEARHPALSAHE